MRIDVIWSIIVTLILMLVCNVFHIGMFGSILLMLCAFLLMNYRRSLKGYWYKFTDLFHRKPVKKEVKSSYYRMDIDE